MMWIVTVSVFHHFIPKPKCNETLIYNFVSANIGVIFIPELRRVGCKLLDFGIAVSMESVERYGQHWEPPTDDTISGAFASPTDFATDPVGQGRGYGTVMFMAPEQSRSSVGKIGTYTDVFGVGSTLHWCLTGSVLLGGSMEDYDKRLCDVKVEAAPALITEKTVTPAVKTLVVELLAKAVRKRPKERFQTAEEMRVAVLAATRAHETSATSKGDEPAATAASANAASSDDNAIVNVIE